MEGIAMKKTKDELKQEAAGDFARDIGDVG
jgi:hypothetical protein